VREELARAEAKKAASVEWLRREVAQLEARAGGRVTPRLLAPVRVAVVPSAGDRRGREDVTVSAMANKVRLEDLATVGVRDGSSLIVTVFDPQVSFFVPPHPSPLRLVPASHTSRSGVFFFTFVKKKKSLTCHTDRRTCSSRI
jgi:hypothetical protein